MADFVLVHGAWHGGWCWKKLLSRLQVAGHRAFALTLTGLGERAHLMSPMINLQTHVQDVYGLIEHEELQGAILVGHSYAGMVITGVAQQVGTEQLSHLVYLDAVVPEPGETWSSGHSTDTQTARRAMIAQSGQLAPPNPEVFGLQGDDHAWVQRRQTPQPGGCYDSVLHFDRKQVQRWPRHFIDCTSPALPTIDASRRRVRTEPGWTVHELHTGHDPMVSAPQELLQVLLQLI